MVAPGTDHDPAARAPGDRGGPPLSQADRGGDLRGVLADGAPHQINGSCGALLLVIGAGLSAPLLSGHLD